MHKPFKPWKPTRAEQTELLAEFAAHLLSAHAFKRFRIEFLPAIECDRSQRDGSEPAESELRAELLERIRTRPTLAQAVIDAPQNALTAPMRRLAVRTLTNGPANILRRFRADLHPPVSDPDDAGPESDGWETRTLTIYGRGGKAWVSDNKTGQAQPYNRVRESGRFDGLMLSGPSAIMLTCNGLDRKIADLQN